MAAAAGLPEECLSLIISLTSPLDACCSAAVSAAFHCAADSDVVWERFLPPDYGDIVSRLDSPVEFSSKKDLFCRLSSTPLLIDGGKKTFSLDKNTSKKSYMLSARELSIAWSTNSLYWSWKSILHSRFSEAVELIMVSWLEIHGKTKIGMLSENTTYAAYLVIQLMDRAFGLDTVACEASIEVGNYKTRRSINLNLEKLKRRRGFGEGEEESIRARGDGWLEVELGEFRSDGRKEEEEVNMRFKETEGVHLKGGIVVDGIELRPKLSNAVGVLH